MEASRENMGYDLIHPCTRYSADQVEANIAHETLTKAGFVAKF
jgi:hypothetical protein